MTEEEAIAATFETPMDTVNYWLDENRAKRPISEALADAAEEALTLLAMQPFVGLGLDIETVLDMFDRPHTFNIKSDSEGLEVTVEFTDLEETA